MLWLLGALGSSLLTSANAELNRRHRQEGFRLNFWRTLLAAGVWLPLALPVAWPHEAGFYAAAVFGGLSMIIGNVIQNQLSLTQNGRVAILWMPMKALFVFSLWAFIDADSRANLLSHPLTAMAILACFGIMVMALSTMRSNDASWHAVKMVLPVALLYGLSDIFCRTVVPHDLVAERMAVYYSVATLVSAGVSLLLYPFRPQRELPWYTPSLLKAGGLAAVQSIGNQACFFIALIYGPNPAYVTMIVLLAPLWLFIYHRLRNIPDHSNPMAGLIMALAAIMLMGVAL